MHHRRSHCFIFTSLLCILCTFQTALQGKRPDPLQAEPWQPAGGLLEARAVHSATLLPDGQILIVGGRDAADAALSSAELYLPQTRIEISPPPPFEPSRPTGSLSQARFGHTATLLDDGRVLVVGGTSNTTLASAEIYDPATELWTLAANLSASRADHAATKLRDGRVLVAGGCQADLPGCAGGEILTSAEVYDPLADQWTPVDSLIFARTSHTATRLRDGRVLVAGGNNDPVNPPAEIFNPATGQWTQTNGVARARAIHTATLLSDGRVVVAGGADPLTGSFNVDSAEVFDPSNNSWTSTGSLATGRGAHTALLLPNERILVTGGRQDPILIGSQIGINGQAGVALASSEIFSSREGTWAAAPASVVSDK